MLRYLTNKLSVQHNNPNARVFARMALINFTANSAFWIIFPLILEDKLNGNNLVGLYYSVLSIAAICVSIFSTYIFQRYSKVTITKVVLSTAILALIGMTFVENIFYLGIFDIPRAMCILVTNISLAIFIRDFSKREEIAINEGRYFMYSNIGCLIGPLLSGFTTKYFGNEAVFILVSMILFISLGYFLLQHLVSKHPHLHHDLHKESISELFSNIKEYFGRPELIKVFVVALGLNFWWAIKGIYMPLTIESLGFGQDIIGIIMTISIIPLVLLESFAASKAHLNGVRRYVIFGFFMLALISSSFYFAGGYLPLLITLFCIVNIGAAFIEPLKDTYFFEVVHKNESEKFFGIYNIAEPFALFFGPIFATIILSNGYGLNVLWLASSIVLLVFALLCFNIKKKY